MFGLFEGTEARRLPGRFQTPWKEILFAAIIVIALASVAYGVSWFVSRADENTSVPAVPAIQQPVAQPFDTTQGKPVQQVPEAVAPLASPLLKWEKIGEASNGDQVMALPIPWDRLIRPATGPTNADPNREMWVWLSSLNSPDSVYGPGKGLIFGYLIEGEKVVLYGLSSQDAHTLDYWKTEVKLSEIKGLRP